MNTKIVNAAIFLVGFGIGSLITNALVKDKYQRAADEEIESVKKRFKKKENDTLKTIDGSLKEYLSIIKNSEYSEKGDEKMDRCMVIAPEEFGEYPDYEKVDLIYFSDGHLTDENYNEINDDSFLPVDYMDSFGDYEDDSVYVVNDTQKRYYCILLDFRSFEDI